MASVDRILEIRTRVMAMSLPPPPPPPRYGPYRRRQRPLAGTAYGGSAMSDPEVREIFRMRPRRFGLDGQQVGVMPPWHPGRPWSMAELQRSAAGEVVYRDITIGDERYR